VCEARIYGVWLIKNDNKKIKKNYVFSKKRRSLIIIGDKIAR